MNKEKSSSLYSYDEYKENREKSFSLYSYNEYNIDNESSEKSEKTSETSNCSSCGGDSIIEDYAFGNLVCNKCGQVLSNIIDNSNEWNQCHEEDVPRCKMPTNVLLPQSSLATTITGSNFSRIKILHNWSSMPYKERSLNNEFKKIHDICLKANILKYIEDDAKILYKIITDCKHDSGTKSGHFVIIRGMNRISISASCLFIACVRNKESRTVSEIASLYNICDIDLNRGYKNLLKLLKTRHIDVKIGTSKPEHFIQRYCDILKIKQIYTLEALKFAKNLYKMNIASKHTPFSQASVCIYLMGEIYELKSLTKKRISYEFGISEMTIVKIYKIIEPYKYILMDNNLTNIVVDKINEQINFQFITPKVLERMKKFGIIRNNIESITKKIKYIIKNILPNETNINKQLEIIKNIRTMESEIDKTISDKIKII
jgi:transcription initiation factor TFIIIB Brf1 subunit/transcription initiation factor TFIIB